MQPEEPDYHSAVGNELWKTRDYESAISEYRETVRLKPGDYLAHCDLGEALQANGDIDAATAEYRAAARLEPNKSFVQDYLEHALEEKAGDGDGTAQETSVQAFAASEGNDADDDSWTRRVIPEWRLGGVGPAIAIAGLCSWELVAVGTITIGAGALAYSYVTGDATGGDAVAELLAMLFLGLAFGFLAWMQWGIWRPRTRQILVPGPVRIMAKLRYPSTHPLYALLELLVGVGFLAMSLDTVAGMGPMPSSYQGDPTRTLAHTAEYMSGITVGVSGFSIYLLMATTRLLAWYVFDRRMDEEDKRTARVAVGMILGVGTIFAAAIALFGPA